MIAGGCAQRHQRLHTSAMVARKTLDPTQYARFRIAVEAGIRDCKGGLKSATKPLAENPMDQTTTMQFPGKQWTTADPQALELSSEALESAADSIFSIKERHGVLFVKRGQVVFERYRGSVEDTTHLFSITKGLGATLLGIAETKGLLHSSDLIREWMPVHHPEIAPDATIGHVLNMTAGTEPAGTAWRYNSNFILNSLTGLVWLASGQAPVDFYNEHLKTPLGLSFDWPANERGWIQIGSQGPLPVIRSTHRDIARLGHLWLNRGRWGEQQILSEEFVTSALTPLVPEVNGAYGFLWWLNAEAGNWQATSGRSGSGRWFPFASEDIFMALGARGKVMIICPSDELIMVSLGETPQEQSGNYLATMLRAIGDVTGASP